MARARFSLVALAVILLSVASASFGQPPAKKFLTANGERPKNALFAPGVMVGKTVYIAGKGDYKPKEELPGKVSNCLNEIRKTLQAAGMDLNNVVKSFVYLEDHDQFPEFNKEYAKFFPENPPARTTLGVSQVPGDSRLEITCIAYSDLSERKAIGTPPPGLPFSPGVLAGDTLYISGKGDQLAGGGHPATFADQVRQAMKNVEGTLKAAGLDFRNVVMSHVFLDKYDNLETANRVYNEFFEDGNEPACATVFVDWIPGGSHVEVTCIATTDLAGRKIVRPSSMKPGPTQAAVTASPAVWAGNTLYISGVAGSRPADGSAPEALAEQAHQMGRNDAEILDAAGLKLDDIVSGCVYLRDMKDYNEMNGIYRKYFSLGPGVRTCLMPNASYEKNNLLVRGSFIAARTR
jgi:2-iminobutanoate/2-iminopropanoate deaminase